jgi:hypothetical protein
MTIAAADDPLFQQAGNALLGLIASVPEWHGHPDADPHRHLYALFQVWLDVQAAAMGIAPASPERWAGHPWATPAITQQYLTLRDDILATWTGAPAPQTTVPALPLITDGKVSLR